MDMEIFFSFYWVHDSVRGAEATMTISPMLFKLFFSKHLYVIFSYNQLP